MQLQACTADSPPRTHEGHAAEARGDGAAATAQGRGCIVWGTPAVGLGSAAPQTPNCSSRRCTPAACKAHIGDEVAAVSQHLQARLADAVHPCGEVHGAWRPAGRGEARRRAGDVDADDGACKCE